MDTNENERASGQIQAAVFDLGKVLVDFDYSIAVRRIAARGTMSAEEIGRVMLTAPLLLEYESGKITSDAFFRRVCDITGYCGELGEFADQFADIFTPIEPMIALQRDLRRQGLPTFIFSNTNDLAIRHIRKSFPFFAGFTGYVLSYEHGLMKPSSEFYEVVEQRTGFRGPEIFYLDDRQENVEPALARGWRAVVHENPDKTLQCVASLGLLKGRAETKPSG